MTWLMMSAASNDTVTSGNAFVQIARAAVPSAPRVTGGAVGFSDDAEHRLVLAAREQIDGVDRIARRLHADESRGDLDVVWADGLL